MTLDPWRDTAVILAQHEPPGGWTGPAQAERSAAEDRVLPNVTFDGECWLTHYTAGPRGAAGTRQPGEDHRVVKVAGRVVLVHRLIFAVTHGLSLAELFATGLQVLHSCDVPRCCNPAHLGAGTNAQNNADMVAKGRQAIGETHGKALLTETDAYAIHARSAAGESDTSIARDLGRARPTVSSVLSGRNWPHVYEATHGHSSAAHAANLERVRARRAARKATA